MIRGSRVGVLARVAALALWSSACGSGPATAAPGAGSGGTRDDAGSSSGVGGGTASGSSGGGSSSSGASGSGGGGSGNGSAGGGKDAGGLYPEAVLAVAAETGTPVIDMTARTTVWLEGLGPTASVPMFAVGDNTHLSALGAPEVAQLAADGIRALGLPIVARLK